LQDDCLELAISGKNGTAQCGGDGGDEVAASMHDGESFFRLLQRPFGHDLAAFPSSVVFIQHPSPEPQIRVYSRSFAAIRVEKTTHAFNSQRE
jgi:hypothetical protein